MKIICISFYLFLFNCILSAQDTTQVQPQKLSNNNIAANLLGYGAAMSLQYDRIFRVNKNFLLSGNVGVGVNSEFQIDICIWGPCPPPPPPERYISLNYHFTGNLGKRVHFMEFGGGMVHYHGQRYNTDGLIPYLVLGYRYQPLKLKKFTFRGQFLLPLTNINNIDFIFFPVTVSFGTTF